MDDPDPVGSDPRDGRLRERPGPARGAGDPAPARERYPGERLLAGSSPREILARLSNGDPLEIAHRATQRLRGQAYLLDLSLVRNRSLARTAYAAFLYRGDPPLEEFLERCIDRALRELIDEDRADVREGAEVGEEDARCAIVAERFGVDAPTARRACLAFNELPHDVRATWYGLEVEGKSFHRIVAEGLGPPERARANLRRALTTLNLLQDPGPMGPDGSAP